MSTSLYLKKYFIFIFHIMLLNTAYSIWGPTEIKKYNLLLAWYKLNNSYIIILILL